MENNEEFEFEPIDYSDVCDVVQRLRHISFGAALNLKLEPHLIRWPDFHEPETIPPFLDAIRKKGDEVDDERLKALAMFLADELERVYEAIKSGLKMPSVEHVLNRYVSGEIGDRTAMRILDLDIHELHEALRNRDMPTIQDEPTVH